MVDDDRAIFMFKDGAMAWDAKDFLVQQDQCKEVTIENKPYYGKNYSPEVRFAVLNLKICFYLKILKINDKLVKTIKITIIKYFLSSFFYF